MTAYEIVGDREIGYDVRDADGTTVQHFDHRFQANDYLSAMFRASPAYQAAVTAAKEHTRRAGQRAAVEDRAAGRKRNLASASRGYRHSQIYRDSYEQLYGEMEAASRG